MPSLLLLLLLPRALLALAEGRVHDRQHRTLARGVEGGAVEQRHDAWQYSRYPQRVRVRSLRRAAATTPRAGRVTAVQHNNVVFLILFFHLFDIV